MDQTEPLQLSASGRPVLLESEVEVYLTDGVSLVESNDRVADFASCTCTLTNLRVLLVAGNAKATALQLSKVQNASKHKSLFSSARIHIYLTNPPARSSSGPHLQLTFPKTSSRDQFYDKLQEQLSRKTWLHIAEANNKKKEKATFSASTAGVGGIMRRVESEKTETQKNLSEAFSDLNSLMEKARELVVLADKFSAQHAKVTSQSDLSSESSTSSTTNTEDAEFNSWMISMGIASPVTKQAAGALFHRELARQLADFMQEPLRKHQGIMLLTDVYCLYNRARGTDLISPEDLYRACALFDDLNINISIKTFDSGVIVLQSKQNDEAQMAARIIALLDEQAQAESGVEPTITAMLLAQKLDISIVLAKEVLLATERRELLCRDETSEGIVFYKNFFANAA